MEKSDHSTIFHPKHKHADVYHHGFSQLELATCAEQTKQFKDIKVEKVFSIKKPTEEDTTQVLAYDGLILIGTKN